jgi:hypothetical protein
MLIGGDGSDRSGPAWHEVYRSLLLGTAFNACSHKEIVGKFPTGIGNFAAMFAEMQTKRMRADYDPDGSFYKSAVITDILKAEVVIKEFAECPIKDRRAFASWVLFRDVSNKHKNRRV